MIDLVGRRVFRFQSNVVNSWDMTEAADLTTMTRRSANETKNGSQEAIFGVIVGTVLERVFLQIAEQERETVLVKKNTSTAGEKTTPEENCNDSMYATIGVGEDNEEYVGDGAEEYIEQRSDEHIGDGAEEYIEQGSDEHVGDGAEEYVDEGLDEYVDDGAEEYIEVDPEEYLEDGQDEYI